jgi:serine/threonine protein kinase
MLLSLHKTLSSQLHPLFEQLLSLQLEDKPFDSGAFGAVYFCHSANGQPLPVPQVVKLLIDDGSGSARSGIRTIQNLQEKIILHNAQLRTSGQKPIEQVNCLLALPQLSFEGSFQGRTVFGYVQNKLDTREFVLFKDFFDEPDPVRKKALREAFHKTPIPDRLRLALDLVEGFQVLRDMAYIHADLNPKNLFIRLHPPALVLIDYDSGVVVNDVQDQADTFGQLGGWIAPEIQAQLMQQQSGRIRVDLNTDTWAVAMAIHYLLFLFHPLDFLRVRGEKQMKQYFSRFRWAEFDPSDANFRTELTQTYQKYRQLLQSQLPAPVLKAFDVTINEGYFNPGKRVTYRQWARVLTEKTQPKAARILSFLSQKLQVLPGENVTISWQVRNAVKVSLNGQVQPEQGSFTFQPQTSTNFVLEAVGTDGKAVTDQLTVKVQGTQQAQPIQPPQAIQLQTQVPPVLQAAVVQEWPASLWPERIGTYATLLAVAGGTYLMGGTSTWYFGLFSLLVLLLFFLGERFRVLPSVKEKQRLEAELDEMEKTWQAETVEATKLENWLGEVAARQQAQEQEVQHQLAPIDQQEAMAKAQRQQELDAKLEPVLAQLKALHDKQQEEISQETEKLYQRVVHQELSRAFILDASIDGLQLIFKGALTLNGILTAADIVDVDDKGNILKRNGEWIQLNALTVNKVKKLWQWRQQLAQEARRKYPQALSVPQKDAIRQKYQVQRQQLSVQEGLLRSQFQLDIQQLEQQYLTERIRIRQSLQQQALQQQVQSQTRLVELKSQKLVRQTQMKKLQQERERFKEVNFFEYLLRILVGG